MPQSRPPAHPSLPSKPWTRPPKRPAEREEREDRDLNERLSNSRRRLMEPPTVIPVVPDSRFSSQRPQGPHPRQPPTGPRRLSESSSQGGQRVAALSKISSSNAIPLGRTGISQLPQSNASTAVRNVTNTTSSSNRDRTRDPYQRFNFGMEESLPGLMARMATDDLNQSSTGVSSDMSMSEATTASFSTERALQMTPVGQRVVKKATDSLRKPQEDTDVGRDVSVSLEDQPLIKRDPSPEPQLSERDEDSGHEFIPMLPECVTGNGEWRVARQRWRARVAAKLLKEGRVVVRTLIRLEIFGRSARSCSLPLHRADGMAIDW